MSASIHDIKPFWLKHPHLLRACCLLLIPFAPLVLLIGAIAQNWRDILRQVGYLYGDLWIGITHKLPSKPIFRPLAGFVGWLIALTLPFGAVVLVFNLFAPNAPLWAFVVLYAGMTLQDMACRAHERKKASTKAGLDEHATNAV